MNFLEGDAPQSISSFVLADTVKIEVASLSMRTQTRKKSHDIMSGIAVPGPASDTALLTVPTKTRSSTTRMPFDYIQVPKFADWTFGEQPPKI
jgi:hypothetical protein